MVETVSIGYVVMLFAAGVLLYVIWSMVKRNQQSIIDINSPAVAGSDELGGSAKNPEQFEEPDDAALDEMADILASAAEAQGIDYEED